MTEEVGGASPRHSRGEPGARPLTLIMLAGEELPLEVDPAGHASLQSFENAVIVRLPLGSKATFGWVGFPISSPKEGAWTREGPKVVGGGFWWLGP